MRKYLFAAAALAACNKPPPPDTCVEGLRATPARLLTRFELDNTLRDLVSDTTRPAHALLPEEPLALGLDNNADVHTVTPSVQARLFDLAEQVAARAVRERRTQLVPCSTPDLACGRQVIDAFGRRAFRRPLTADEASTVGDLFETVLAGEGFDPAVEAAVTAFLLSPQFLYRLEPFVGAEPNEPLSDAALASRLSYFIWGSMPDATLSAAAESGALSDPAKLESEAKRMLEDPRAADPAAHFFSLYLGLDTLAGLEKAQAQYPAFTPAMRGAWRRSIELYLGDVFTRERTLKSMLTSSVLFVDENMGGMYGNGPVPPAEFIRLEMPLTQRTGLLTQPGFLARLSAPDQSSPVRRGVFVLEKVMCEVVAPPPPQVMAVPPEIDPSLTTRERFGTHTATAGCSGCHLRIDGIGFGFEHFDGMGAYRTTDNGKPVDASGEVVQANEAALDGEFTGANQLMTRLASARQVHDCMSLQWYRFALGRVESDGDKCSTASVQREFFEGQGDFDALRLAVVKAPSFRVHAQEVSP